MEVQLDQIIQDKILFILQDAASEHPRPANSSSPSNPAFHSPLFHRQSKFFPRGSGCSWGQEHMGKTACIVFRAERRPGIPWPKVHRI